MLAEPEDARAMFVHAKADGQRAKEPKRASWRKEKALAETAALLVLSKHVRVYSLRAGDNVDPHKIWATMFANEKSGGHGERSVAIGTIDMAICPASASKGRPTFSLRCKIFPHKPPKCGHAGKSVGMAFKNTDFEKILRQHYAPCVMATVQLRSTVVGILSGGTRKR
ncbi:hypothetical protein JOE11_003527 [Robbsia andropogonis]